MKRRWTIAVVLSGMSLVAMIIFAVHQWHVRSAATVGQPERGGGEEKEVARHEAASDSPPAPARPTSDGADSPSQAESAPPSAVSSWSISGTIFVETRDAPLGQGDVGVRIRRGSYLTARRFTTGADGSFSLGGFPSGDYTLLFEYGDFCPVEAIVSLTATVPPPRLEVYFEPGIQAWGTVRSLDELPLPEMLMEWQREGSSRPPVAIETDATGSYRTPGLTAGRYGVRIRPKRFRDLWEAVSPKFVTIRESGPQRFDFTVDGGQVVTIRLLRSDGNPVTAARVGFRLDTERTHITGFFPLTDPDGRAWLRGLPPAGTLTIRATDAALGAVEERLQLGQARDEVRLVFGGVR